MADEFFRVFGTPDVQPVNRVVKANKYSEEESGGGSEPFDSILARELAKKKEKPAKDKAPQEKLKKMEGLNQYDARANAFFYRLTNKADYRA